jgi:P-type Cu2+ transporter
VTKTVLTCFHCGGPIPAHQLVSDDSLMPAKQFCCRGCLGAYRLISGAGLTDFYQRRSPDPGGLAAGAFTSDYSEDMLADYVYSRDGKQAVDILIDGIRCASCVWLNETVLAAVPGVLEVRINYATGRACVVYSAAETGPAAIFQRITALGYVPRPYSTTAAEQANEAQRHDLLLRFGTAVFLSMQLMAFAFALYAGYFQGISSQAKNYLNYFSWLVTTPLVGYCGWPFLRGAWRSLSNRTPSMDLLIVLGSLSSYGYSCYALLLGGDTYFETAAMIITLILAGRLLELGARRQALAGVARLRELTPTQAKLLNGDTVVTVAVTDIGPGALLLVGTGERFPVDGVVASGVAEVDESPATGESLPVIKEPGAPLIAGSVNVAGAVRMRATKSAADSFVAIVARLVEEAQNRRTEIQQLADRLSGVFVPLVLGLALVTFIVLLASGLPFGPALLRALAVVVIACPCALGLATPTAILVGTGTAAAQGIIFRGGDVLERLAQIGEVVFDKTGTITLGKPVVQQIFAAPGVEPDRLLAAAAAVEVGSCHPLASGIVTAACERGIVIEAANNIAVTPGKGVAGQVAADAVLVGSDRYLAEQGIVTPHLELMSTETAVLCAIGGNYAGHMVLTDVARPGIAEVVRYFQQNGLAVSLYSGDRPAAATAMAGLVGIDAALGGLGPAEKAALLAEKQQRHVRVMMVGDGINDAPALASADVGCAFAGGTDIALATSDLVLTVAEPARLQAAHQAARQTMAIIRQNLAWALVYNLVGIPLAMAGVLTPIYAALAMALSSVCVVLNSLRLRIIING